MMVNLEIEKYGSNDPAPWKEANMKRISSAALAVLILLALAIVPASAAPLAPPPGMHTVYVTDINSSGFNVSWTTDVAADGFVDFGTGSCPSGAFSSTATDPVTSTTTHYVRVSVPANTTVFFQTRSTGVGTDKNGGACYTAQAGSFTNNNPGTRPVLSDVKTAGAVDVPNAIVYLDLHPAGDTSCTTPGSGRFTQRTDDVGSWLQDLDNILNTAGSAQYAFTDGTAYLHILVQGGSAGTYEACLLTPANYDAGPFGYPTEVLNGTPNAVGMLRLSGQTAIPALPLALTAVGLLACGAIALVMIRRRRTEAAA